MKRILLCALLAMVALVGATPAGADTRSYAHTHCNAYTHTLGYWTDAVRKTTSQCDPYQFARSSGTQTVVYVVVPPRGSPGLPPAAWDYWLYVGINNAVAKLDARPDMRVVRTAVDPGYGYNVIKITRRALNGGISYPVFDFADPNRTADAAKLIKRRNVVTFDNAGPWSQYYGIRIGFHEVAGHAGCSLEHPPAEFGYGPTDGRGNLTWWDDFLCDRQNIGLVAGAPRGM